jgi:hypothetical protein
MANIEKKSYSEPDEKKQIGRMKVEQVTIGSLKFTRNTAAPGWRWSVDIKPAAKTDSCQVNHLFFLISGKLLVQSNDGSEMEFSSGDMGVILPGHDGWTVGDEPAVWIELPH